MLVIAAIMWAAFATVFFFIWENRKLEAKKTKWDSILEEAKKESDNIIKEARKEAESIIKKSEKIEERIIEREEKLEEKLDLLDKKRDDLIIQEDNLKIELDNLKQKEIELDGKLSEIAKLTEEEAKEIFLKQIEEKYSSEALDLIKKYKKKLEDRKKELAREIILKSIQQYAWDVTSEVTTTVIEIPWDDIKGKLIGKEGRNITTFEKETWVALIIDDTPDTVFISAFDLFKRYIAKKSLEKLIEDWRIQPARIEEVVEKTTAEADILLRELWEKIIDELGVEWLIPDELVPIIWKLRFRTSYWQNILKHSKETALIAESIASDLWLDSKLVKVWGLLHDIWKALDQEIEWTHPEIGWKLARKYGLRSEIIDMIENHHWEQFSISIEAAIVQVADAISSVRPWARREAIEQYVKRVQEMEALVASFSGVNKAYAISAWREVRVFVDADTISDLQAQNMAKEIAENIQEKLSYPWEVKVNLIREMRVIEFAK
jgi:ribonuclease Y